jgi:hypothetical protein
MMGENGRSLEKVSIGKCKLILEKNGCNYTDKEIEKIRDFLYILGEIEYENYLKTQDDEKSHIIC